MNLLTPLLTLTFLLGAKPAPAGFERAPSWTAAATADDDVIAGEYIVRIRPRALTGVGVEGGRFTGPLARRLAVAGDVRPMLRTPTLLDNAPGRRLAGTFVVRSALSLDELRDQLEDTDSIESVEPRTHLRALAEEPNDTWYHFQWNMMEAEVATLHTTHTGTGVVVAVIDSGVTPGGADSFVSLLPGYDFIDQDEDASDDDAMISGLAHGTHVAGTIAQTTGNVEGVVGIAPGASILPVRVLHYDEASGAVWGASDDIANGIIWAVDHGAQVINMSLGSPTRSDAVADACEYAYESGVFVVASSGNDGNPDGVLYPASLPCAFAVGAVGREQNIPFYSNGGPELDLVAPGGEDDEDRDGDGHGDGIVQESITMNGWRYVFSQGTSMAAPHVAAAAALLVQNGWTDPAQIGEVLVQSAHDILEPGHDDQTGFGEMDIQTALAFPVDPAYFAQRGTVVIDNVTTDYSMDGRVWVSWTTNVAATTRVAGTDTDVRESLATHLHKALIKGAPGFATSVTLSSTADGTTAEEVVALEFPLDEDSLFSGCTAESAGWLFLPGIAAWRRSGRRARTDPSSGTDSGASRRG